MNPLQSPPYSFFQSNPTLFDDAEMLQTDVMRFFAILSLCLMAIFALVKTLPMAPPDTRPAMVEPADQKAEVKRLQNKITVLKEKLVEMQNRVQAETTAAEHASTRAITAAKTEETVLNRVVRVKQELAKVSQMLIDTQNEIKLREVNLEQLLKNIADKRRVRAELTTQINNENQSLSKIREKMAQVQEKMDQNYKPKEKPPQKPSKIAPSREPTQKGFTLRFASDEALDKLIAAGIVNFYAIAGKNAWRIKLSDGSPIYTAVEFPRQIYEMEPHTVPIDYKVVFQQQIAVFGRRTLTWGVTLPGRTTDSITQMVRIRKGGDLIITADGEVKLN